MRQNSAVETVGVKPQIILFGSDAALLEQLKQHSAGMSYITYEVGYGPEVAQKAHLDAVWTTLMGGVELFDAEPPFPQHEARVLRTPGRQLERGFPRYGIVGVALSPEDPKSPEYSLGLVISALLKAVKDFNSQGRDQIHRVGILPDDLELRRLEPAAAFKIIRLAYEGMWARGEQE